MANFSRVKPPPCICVHNATRFRCREIDDIMQEDYTPDSEPGYDSFERHKPAIHAPLYEDST